MTFASPHNARVPRPPKTALRGLVLLVTTLLVTSGAAQAGVAGPLAIPINLRCTTCDDFIRCAADGVVADPATGRAPSTLYRLREKTFWAQVATIGDYLLQFFVAKTTDQRPYAVYRDDGARITTEYDPDQRAAIDAGAAHIRIGAKTIDQQSGAWLDERGNRVGQCAIVSRRAGYAVVRDLLGQGAIANKIAAWPEFVKPADCR